MPVVPKASVEPDAPVRSMSAAISNAVVGLVRDYTGRGPTRVRTTISPNMIVVTLRDCLTKGERALAQDGHVVEVLALRHAMQHTMREDMVTAVESLTGRRVEALLNDILPEPDIAVQVFLMDGCDHNGDHAYGGQNI